MGKKFKVKVPTRPPAQVQISAQLEEATDMLRSHFSDFLMGHLKDYEALYKYGKLKGWTDVEPAYKSYKPTDKEQVSVSEAYHVWEHLNYRYDQMELTNIYLDFVHDTDFKMILKEGLSTLENQIQTLEKEAIKFDISLPERPPASMASTIDPEIMTDKFAFRSIFTGMQSATNLHIRAVINTIRNDPLRSIFFDFLKKELNLYDKFLKYGKIKGWLHVVPTFRHIG